SPLASVMREESPPKTRDGYMFLKTCTCPRFPALRRSAQFVRREGSTDQLLAAACEKLDPCLVERPEVACVRVGLLARPAVLHLSVDGHEAGDAVVHRAVHENLRISAFVHGRQELSEVVDRGCVELDGDMVVAKPERLGETRLVGKTVPRIEKAEIDDRAVAFCRKLAELVFRRLAGGSDVIVDRKKVRDRFEGHGEYLLSIGCRVLTSRPT